MEFLFSFFRLVRVLTVSKQQHTDNNYVKLVLLLEPSLGFFGHNEDGRLAACFRRSWDPKTFSKISRVQCSGIYAPAVTHWSCYPEPEIGPLASPPYKVSHLSHLFRNSSRLKVIFLSGWQWATFKSHESSWRVITLIYSGTFSTFFSQGEQSNLGAWTKCRCLCFGGKFHLSRHENRWMTSYKNFKGNCKNAIKSPGWPVSGRKKKEKRKVFWNVNSPVANTISLSMETSIYSEQFMRHFGLLEQGVTAQPSEQVFQLSSLWKCDTGAGLPLEEMALEACWLDCCCRWRDEIRQ